MSLQEDILEGYMYQQYIQRLESAKPHLKFRHIFCISVVVLSKWRFFGLITLLIATQTVRMVYETVHRQTPNEFAVIYNEPVL